MTWKHHLAALGIGGLIAAIPLLMIAALDSAPDWLIEAVLWIVLGSALIAAAWWAGMVALVTCAPQWLFKEKKGG